MEFLHFLVVQSEKAKSLWKKGFPQTTPWLRPERILLPERVPDLLADKKGDRLEGHPSPVPTPPGDFFSIN